jgi:L-aminopeptidase/D-esterase-like protein
MSESATFTIGHWTDYDAKTGCTAIIFDRLVPAAFEARGGAPGTRETDLLRPSASVRSVDAILLSGGSAPGLSAADGVVRFLQEHQRGFPTFAGPIPIVPAAIIYDLAVGQPDRLNRSSAGKSAPGSVPELARSTRQNPPAVAGLVRHR